MAHISRQEALRRLTTHVPPPMHHREDYALVMSTLLALCSKRHYEQKQVWIELYWDHLAEKTRLAYPNRFIRKEISTETKQLVKNQLLSMGYSVRNPPAGFEHEGILVEWRFSMYGYPSAQAPS